MCQVESDIGGSGSVFAVAFCGRLMDRSMNVGTQRPQVFHTDLYSAGLCAQYLEVDPTQERRPVWSL